MPTPSNAPATTTGGREVQDPQLFAELTERQAMPQVSQAIAGLGKKQRLLIEKVGVLARIRLKVKCEFTPKEETTQILNPGFPFKLIREIALQANGVTGVIDCSGVTLAQRRQRVYRNPVSAIFKSPKTGEKLKKEAQKVEFVIEIPIAHDMLSLIGCILAQNEETQLSVLVNWASEEEIVNGGAGIEKFEGEVTWSTTVFSIGSTVEGKNEVVVLPDLSAFHGLIDNVVPLVTKPEPKAELIRTAGQLLCYCAAILNKAGGQAQLTPAEWEQFKIEYGGNKDPLVWAPATELLEDNADDYDGALTVGAAAASTATALTFLAYDAEKDHPSRDLIIPESLTELRAVIKVPGAFTPESAQILTSQETLYPAV